LLPIDGKAVIRAPSDDLSGIFSNGNFRKKSRLPSPSAMTHYVDTCADDYSLHSLRTLVGLAGDGDTIDLTQLPMFCSRITLDENHVPGHISITQKTLQLVGPGMSNLTIDGNHASSIFRHTGYSILYIYGITIANGNYVSDATPRGGCIYSTGEVYLVNSSVTDCIVTGTGSAPASGGGIYVRSYLTLHRSSLTNNLANAVGGGASWGGGADAEGNFSAEYSTIRDNEANASGNSYSYAGGLLVWGGYAGILSSTISGNRADFVGGFDHNCVGANARVINSTISGNVANDYGGVLVHGYLEVSNSTIAFNRGESSTPAGLYSKGPLLILQSSIIADNRGVNGPNDVGGSPTTQLLGSNNLITYSTLPPLDDTIQECPRLDPLLDNGGSTDTYTHALRPLSPAINGGAPFGLTRDQRGMDRVGGIAADIGAFEWHGEPEERVFASGFEGGCNE
jgi:hypothetical protein